MDRKKFILSSSFFLVGMNFLKASSLILPSDFQLYNTNNLDISFLLKKAADLRKSSFEQKQDKGSMSRRMFFSSPKINTNEIYALYDKVIEIKPFEIRAYNGKRKLMLQDSKTGVDIINMYVQGAELNGGNAIFKERLAKEYLRVLSGNRKILQTLPDSFDNMVIHKVIIAMVMC
ncbi:hypothetical protein [Myroides sp. LoEW2-1]|uniref:hypothetical protein n=1 Tax=Myroides sp. LoEW2-1 TaxID=2683192 RepID=UPI0013276B33|nr:hypothetical protein [Myroides sp. LoEW2-1]MVX35319.1 hypothetical protein [Myroides sp. LoEW2-1]